MIYVSPFLGAGADWLCLLDPTLVPLVSWMGGKRRLAADLLALLDLRPGRPVPALLGDASWWGWVWPVVLDAETGPRVSATLRSWRNEDPRALWFRLRDLGPITDDVAAAVAQLLWLQARAASGVPVWWEGEYSWTRDVAGVWRCHGPGGVLLAAPGDGRERQLAADRGANGLRQHTDHNGAEGARQGGIPANLVSMDGHGRGPYRAWMATGVPAADARLVSQSGPTAGGRGVCAASMSGDKALLLASDGRGDPRETGQRTTRQDRLVATTRGGQEPGAPFEAGHKGTDTRGGGGIVDPGTIADRADAIRAARARQALGEVAILHTDARTLTEEWAPRLWNRALVYLDPPYAGATGYPVACARSEVLAIAETWARHGARVVLSEAVGLAAELGAGWKQLCLRSSPKP